MKKVLSLLVAIFTFAAASTALAAHDHGGSLGSTGHNSHQQEQSAENADVAKETDTLLDNCTRKVNSIQRRINNLRGDLGRRSTTSIVEELKKLEQALKEADEIVRPLQVF